MGDHLRCNARSCVPHPEAYVLSFQTGGKGERAAVLFHGVKGIENQIQQDLGKLQLVSVHPDSGAGKLQPDLDSLRLGGLCHAHDLFDQLIRA